VSPVEQGPEAERRRAAVRRAELYTALFVAMALVVAMLGAALVAWLLTWTGLPFRRTWLIVTIVTVLPGLLAAVWKFIRQR
jgi:uncharacterized protein YacL